MLTQQDTLMSSQPQISTLVFQEQSTLPLSDACSKSVSCQFDMTKFLICNSMLGFE